MDLLSNDDGDGAGGGFFSTSAETLNDEDPQLPLRTSSSSRTRHRFSTVSFLQLLGSLSRASSIWSWIIVLLENLFPDPAWSPSFVCVNLSVFLKLDFRLPVRKILLNDRVLQATFSLFCFKICRGVHWILKSEIRFRRGLDLSHRIQLDVHYGDSLL